jgi:hypothetical protein
LLEVSWKQFSDFLGDEGPAPEWNVRQIRTETGDKFFVESMTMNDPFRETVSISLQNKDLKLSLTDLTDDEIKTICYKRAALKKAGKNIEECPLEKPHLGGLAYNLLLMRDVKFGEHLENTYKLLKLTGKTQKRFDIYLFGHTHMADDGFNPLKSNWNPRVMNSGAWQRVALSAQLDEIRKNNSELRDSEILENMKLEDLPPCYSVIMIEPYGGKDEPEAVLRYWRRDDMGGWNISRWCEWKPTKISKQKNGAVQQ